MLFVQFLYYNHDFCLQSSTKDACQRLRNNNVTVILKHFQDVRCENLWMLTRKQDSINDGDRTMHLDL